MAKISESRSKSFLLRDLDSSILMGMVSDRYAGWIGQIYSEGRYEKGITRRSHKIGGRIFNEETRPVESVPEYFKHFTFLEIDYPFAIRFLIQAGTLARFSMSPKGIDKQVTILPGTLA